MIVRRLARLLFVLSLLFGTVVSTAATGVARQEGDGPAVKLKAAEFSPSGDSTADGTALDRRGNGYYIVQFGGPILQSQADAVRAAGADILNYIPDYAYKVRMRPALIDDVAGVDGITWVGAFEADFKLSPDLAADGLYRVRIERGVDREQVAAAIEAAGAQVISGSGTVLAVSSDRATLEAVAQIADVAWVENLEFREKHNEFGAGVIVGANTANAAGYDGSTQIVAVADTGLGNGTSANAHPDIPSSRIVDVQNWPYTGGTLCSFGGSSSTVIGDGAQDVDSGHGTHVSVSVLGDGSVTGLGQGTAPAASLVFQATEDYVQSSGICASFLPSGYYLLGLPDDLEQLLQAAYDQGARIHSDSWGSDADGDYTADAASVDNFAWVNQDFLMTTSAGNDGADLNNNGVVDDDTTGSPATAKNVLTVGASENDRGGDWSCDSGTGNGCTGQNDIFTYGSAWPADFPVNPIASDPSAGNAEQMAAFSSRGPTDDGRIKPDVVAPGTWILSGYSDLYQEGYDGVTNPQNGAFQYDGWGYPVSDEYKYMGGTSMSNPITAGAAAVVRDYYNKAHGAEASGALTKATLINSAVDLLDENNDGANDNDFPIPNSHEGWGRVAVANAVDGSAEWVDQSTGLTTGGSNVYTYTTDGSTNLKVSLVWSDFPSTETASVNLVNNLNLTVTGPGGTYNGNVFSGGWSTTGGSADSVNNVENVYIQNAAAGTWTVTVSGANVPMGPQPFALVVDGTGTAGPNNPPTAGFGSSCTDLTCTFTDTSSDSDGSVVSWAWDFGDGNTSTAQNPVHTYTTANTYTVSLTVTDDVGDSDSTSASVTANDPPNNPPTAGFSSSCTDLDCDFTDTSSDTDGSIVAWSWVFGDGATSDAQHPSHSYAAGETYTVSLTVTDDDGDSDTTSASVTATDPGSNNPPTAGFISNCSDLDCTFTDTSGDSDGSVVAWSWAFGDGGTSNVQDPSYSYAAAGTYMVTLTVTDDGSGSASTTNSVTVTAPTGGTTMHIADLDGSGVSQGRRWTAMVTVRVVDNNGVEVNGATVTGTWRRGAVSTCTTDTSGTCLIEFAAKGRYDIFTVSGVTHGSLTYDATANSDPDGDSNGTSITVNRP
jgi:serine protease AprX